MIVAEKVQRTSEVGDMAQKTGKAEGITNLKQDGKLGVIEVGAYADILIVDGNPLEDITAIGGNAK